MVGYSVADEITKLDQLKKSGSLTDEEFRRLSRQTRLAAGTARSGYTPFRLCRGA